MNTLSVEQRFPPPATPEDLLAEPKCPPTRRFRPVAIDALTSLRGLAALWVVVFHFNDDLHHLFGRFPALDSLIQLGYLAVPYFFILSGFVLAYNYAPEFRRVSLPGYLGFLKRRWL